MFGLDKMGKFFCFFFYKKRSACFPYFCPPTNALNVTSV